MTTHITKTWFDGEKVMTQEIPESEVYKQEPVAWKNAAMRLGEELSSVGPDGYYDMTAEQWLSWAMDQRPTGKQSLQVEPVAWMHWLHGPVRLFMNKDEAMMELNRLDREYPVDEGARQMRPLYTAPPQRQPLQVDKDGWYWVSESECISVDLIRTVEKLHGIGGGHE